jgi:hypothetical protein
MEAIVESKFDKFANDFYRFCSIRYDTTPNFRIKVVQGTWEATIPPKLVHPAKPSYPVITFDWTNADSEQEQQQVLQRLGFTEQDAKEYSNYDALIFLNNNKPVKMRDGTVYMWNIILAHHILHLIEIQTKELVIDEPPNQHDYEHPEALQHMHRFVNWVGGIDTAIDRYVPHRD